MARLTIGNGVDGIATISGRAITQMRFDFSSVKTLAMEVEPEMDRSGRDLLCVKISLEIVGIVSKVAIATNKDRATPPGPEGTGDDMPWTNALARDLLMVPRNRVRFEIGSQTVLLSPGQNAKTGAFFKTDVKGGPFPQRASYTQFVGEKMALLHYRVVTFVNYGLKSSALLSNRWVMNASIDEYAYTTRTTRGVAVFRKDFMEVLPPAPPLLPPAMPDDFRPWLLVPVSEGMRRTSVDVTQNEDGTELEYTVVDTEETFGTGDNSWVVSMSGTATVGIDTPVKDIRSAVKAAVSIAGSALKLDFVALAEKVINSACPTNRNVAVMRATGAKDADRQTLILMAAYACLDRLIPVYTGAGVFGVGAKGAIVSNYLTMNLDTAHAPYAECKIEIIGFNKNVLTSLLKADPSTLINTSTTIKGPRDGIAGLPWGPTEDSVRLPASTNSRGTWLKRLMSEALRAPQNVYDLPDDPPPSISAVDTRGPA